MDTTGQPRTPQSQILGREAHPLDSLFGPRTVAVIGATERTGHVGRTILWNLISSPFGGTVFPVNLRRSSVLGIRAYPAIAEVPGPVDLAVVATPAPSVPPIIRDCVTAGVKSAIVVSAGFREAGPDGLEIEREVVAEARRGHLRLIGPSSLGVMSPVSGLNATYATAMVRRGTVGFLSQSRALCAAVIDWSLRMNVGFSHFVSIGSMADVGWGDLIDYLGGDPHARSIVIHMDSVGDARAFLSAAREVALAKPIIVIKAGRTAAGARAAAAHTGLLTGSDEVFDAACRRSGILRVDTIADLFNMAEVLGRQPRPRGPRLAIVTNAGGPGAIAADALAQGGGELVPLSGETIEAYQALLPAAWSRSNPVDLLDDADPDRYTAAVDIALKDPSADGLLVVLTPQARTDPTQTAEQVRQKVAGVDKPVLASWLGGADVAAGEAILNRANVPTFSYPDTAARVFAMMWRYSDNLRGLYETPALPAEIVVQGTSRRERVEALVQQVRASGRSLLTARESAQVLAEYGIAVVETALATSADEAVSLALEASPDPQFGPVLRFGAGGRPGEVYRDHALGLAPLNTTLARRMMEQTRIYQALKDVCGRGPADLAALEELVVRFSYLVVEQPWIREIAVNPLLVSSERAVALEARIVVHGPEVAPEALPRLAIRPYPIQYVHDTVLRDGTAVTIRPIRPEDEPAMVRFHEGLSERSVYFRYFHVLNLAQRVAHERLTRICFNDYDREIALVAEHTLPAKGESRIVAVARLTRVRGSGDAEFAVIVTDALQGKGLGTQLVGRLLDVAEREGMVRLVAAILPENREMQRICERYGFKVAYSEQTQMLHAQLVIAQRPGQTS